QKSSLFLPAISANSPSLPFIDPTFHEPTQLATPWVIRLFRLIIHSARRWCGSKGNPSLQPHPSPIHSVARFPTLSTNEREWGPPRRTTSCTLPIFSCDSHVGFDFGIRKMKE